MLMVHLDPNQEIPLLFLVLPKGGVAAKVWVFDGRQLSTGGIPGPPLTDLSGSVPSAGRDACFANPAGMSSKDG